MLLGDIADEERAALRCRDAERLVFTSGEGIAEVETMREERGVSGVQDGETGAEIDLGSSV